MKEKNIYQKLLEIQKHVDAFIKDSQSFGYKYVSGNKVLKKIRPLMNEFGLILKQEVTEIENQRQDYQTKNGNKSEILTKTIQRFTWVDVDTGQMDVNMFAANGMNDWEKGLGSALTYAERYFLLKYFHVPTDEDDIDNPERKKQSKRQIDVWLNTAQFEKLKKESAEKIKKALEVYNGTEYTDGKVYQMKKSYREQLEKILKTK